jgi:tetratricopeptide (TPR) repeat protein
MKSIKETLRLIRKIKPLGAIFYILDLFPGTEMYDKFLNARGHNDDIWLQRIEDIMYFETDTALDSKDILRFGKKLRSGFYSMVTDFALSVSLVDVQELYPFHADFLARLGMTFLTGDYSRIKEIRNSGGTAEKLFRRALSFSPSERAYLGLGILGQMRGDYAGSASILQEGLQYFDTAQLNICYGISLANSGRLDEAARLFSMYPDRYDAMQHLLGVSRALGNKTLEKETSRRIACLEKQKSSGAVRR